jgi:hypothetical protein
VLAPAPLNPRGAQDSEKKGITRERLRFLRRWVLHSYSSQRSQVGFLTHARGDSESDESESESEGGDDSEEGSLQPVSACSLPRSGWLDEAAVLAKAEAEADEQIVTAEERLGELKLAVARC